MSVFEDLRNGKSYDILDELYIKEAHSEMARCRHLCWEIDNTDPNDSGKIITLERELFNGDLKQGSFL